MQRSLIIETKDRIGQEVKIAGWVNIRRDHGKLIFLDIRDESGIVQVVVIPQVSPEAYKTAQDLRSEFVVEIIGKVNARPKGNINEDLTTGTVEIEVKALTIINKSENPPFEITNDGLDVNEEVRLKYRYLDLRRERMQKNIRLRSDYMQALRRSLLKKEFVEGVHQGRVAVLCLPKAKKTCNALLRIMEKKKPK